MKKVHAVRTLLLTSILSLLLTVAMLAGTTFAWFYEWIHMDGNVIRSGTLLADLSHKSEGNWLSLADNPTHKVFDYDGFEAGEMQLATLRVSNEGTLALRYQLLVSQNKATEVLGPNGENLLDVLDVYICYAEESANSPEELVSSTDWVFMGTLADLLAQKYIGRGRLLPYGEHYAELESGDGATRVGEACITIALQMHEPVNPGYLGLTLGELSFSLFSTQADYEKDSFNDLYDKNVTSPLVFDDGEAHEVTGAVILTPGDGFTETLVATGSNTSVNIVGGYYDAADQGSAVLGKDNAEIVISGGNFVCDGNNADRALIVAESGSKVSVVGGMFYAREDGTPLLKEDGGDITVYGGTFVGWNPADNNGVNHLPEGTVLQTEVKNGETYYTVGDLDNVFVKDASGSLNLTADTVSMNAPIFHNRTATEPYVIDGNGHTVTINAFADTNLDHQWSADGKIPTMSTMFSSANNSLVTVKDLTITGKMQAVSIGNYGSGDKFTTVLENFKIKDASVCSMSNIVAPALIAYGKLTMNNCEITGTRIVEEQESEGWGVYSAGFPNNTKVYLNDCYLESIFMWELASVNVNAGTRVDYIYARGATAKTGLWVNEGGHVGTLHAKDHYTGSYWPTYIRLAAGSRVDVLDVTEVHRTNKCYITVEAGASIGKVVDDGVEYATVAEWWAAHTAA